MAFNQNEWAFPITEAYNPGESYMVTYARWVIQQQSLRIAVAPITRYLYSWIIRLMPRASFDAQSFDVNFRLALGLVVPVGIALLFAALLIWVILRVFDFSNNECIDKACKENACRPHRRTSVDSYCDDSSLSSKEEDQDEDKPKEVVEKPSNPPKKPKKKVSSVTGELKLRNRNVTKTVEKPAKDEETEC